MPASFFLRSKQAFVAQMEIGLSAVERVSHGSMSRDSVREIEAAQEQARESRFQAERRRGIALARRDLSGSEAATWGEKAAYALTKDRTDLAERAVERQIDCEAAAVAASQEATKAEGEIVRLTALTIELGEERRRMSAELKALEHERSSTDDEDGPLTIEQRAERARARFGRMIEDARPDGETDISAAASSNLDALRRADAVEERLATMRAAAGSKRKRG